MVRNFSSRLWRCSSNLSKLWLRLEWSVEHQRICSTCLQAQSATKHRRGHNFQGNSSTIKVSQFLQRFDLDKNGVLTKKEVENSDKTLGPEIIEGLFLVADTNLDGQITSEEFKQISTAFGQQTEKVGFSKRDLSIFRFSTLRTSALHAL